jgi:uncharacterized damage-inducible protein DinB
MNLTEIRHLFEYTEWANTLVNEAAAQLSEEELHGDVNISHGSIFGTLLHMAGAEWIWLERWQGHSPAGPNAWDLWKVENCPDLIKLSERWQEVIDRRNAFLAGLDESRLSGPSPFTLLSGASDSMRLIDQMQHVVNHATLHRGQVVGMIRQLGNVPPATDLLFYLRAKRG